MAVVNGVIDDELGKANITYVVEPTVEELLQRGWIMINDGGEIEQFYEIGARIKIKWSKQEVGDTNWRPGWYVAEVRDADRDNDQITVQFVSEPEEAWERASWRTAAMCNSSYAASYSYSFPEP